MDVSPETPPPVDEAPSQSQCQLDEPSARRLIAFCAAAAAKA